MYTRVTPLALGFAALVMGLAAGPAQADRQQGDYCSAPEVCNQRQIGIIQKERDGVNYFYGGSDVAPPQVNYIYLRDDNVDQPVNISNVNTTRTLSTAVRASVQDEEGPLEEEKPLEMEKAPPRPVGSPGPLGWHV